MRSWTLPGPRAATASHSFLAWHEKPFMIWSLTISWSAPCQQPPASTPSCHRQNWSGAFIHKHSPRICCSPVTSSSPSGPKAWTLSMMKCYLDLSLAQTQYQFHKYQMGKLRHREASDLRSVARSWGAGGRPSISRLLPSVLGLFLTHSLALGNFSRQGDNIHEYLEDQQSALGWGASSLLQSPWACGCNTSRHPEVGVRAREVHQRRGAKAGKLPPRHVQLALPSHTSCQHPTWPLLSALLPSEARESISKCKWIMCHPSWCSWNQIQSSILTSKTLYPITPSS